MHPQSDMAMMAQVLAEISKGQQSQTLALRVMAHGQNQTAQALERVAQAHGQSNVVLGSAMQSLGSQMGVMRMLQVQTISALTAPKQLIRDEDGRPAGVVTVGQ